MGYVGLSNAVLLAQRHEVVALGGGGGHRPGPGRRRQRRRSPIRIRRSRSTSPAWSSTFGRPPIQEAYTGARFVVVATPTDYDPDANFFDTSSVEAVIAQVTAIEPAAIVLKSTIPVGLPIGCARSTTP